MQLRILALLLLELLRYKNPCIESWGMVCVASGTTKNGTMDWLGLYHYIFLIKGRKILCQENEAETVMRKSVPITRRKRRSVRKS